MKTPNASDPDPRDPAAGPDRPSKGRRPDAAAARRVRASGLGLLVAALVLGIAELVARLTTGPPVVPLVAELPTGATAWFTETDGALTPTWQGTDTIPPVPLVPPEDGRVLWLGGSSVHSGNPDVRLDAETPALVGRMIGVEVVNLGGPGMDSGTIAAMVPEALRLRPDVVVFYEGHNDLGNAVFTNRYGDPRTVFIARTRGWLGASRLFGLLEARVRSTTETVRLPTPGNEGSFRIDASRRALIHARFEERLRAIAAMVRASGAELVLLTPISNPLTPYLEPACPAELAALRLGNSPRPEPYSVQRVKPEQLEAAFDAAPDCPELRWVAARQAADRGEPSALEALDLLRDEDPYPLRADRRMVQVVRDVAETERARLGDVSAVVRAHGGGLEPAAYFTDFVHPTAAGHRAIAAVAAPEVARALDRTPPETALPPFTRRPYAACHTLECLRGWQLAPGAPPPGAGPPNPRRTMETRPPNPRRTMETRPPNPRRTMETPPSDLPGPTEPGRAP